MSVYPSAVSRRFFMEQECREKVVQAFDLGLVRELFPEEGRYQVIKDVVEKDLQHLIDTLVTSGRTQTVDCSDPFNMHDRSLVKVRRTGSDGIDVLFYRRVGKGTSKEIYGAHNSLS